MSEMMKHLITALALFFPTFLPVSCAHSPDSAPGATSVDRTCAIAEPPVADADERSGGASEHTGPVTVALLDDFDPAHAPVARTSSERVVFAHLYETLVRVDCRGRVRPGLAVSWREEESGRRWSFTLREGATFWDGSPVTPREVVASWAEAARSLRDGTLSPSSAPLPTPRRFTVKGDGSFEVVFSPPYPGSPTAFAHPATAVRGASAADGWPLGSGPYRPSSPGETGDDAPASGRADGDAGVLAVRSSDRVRPARPPLRFRLPEGRDARDLLDSDVDLFVSRDPEVLSYAMEHPRFVAVPLPWDRLYVFVPPRPTSTVTAGEGSARHVDHDVTALRRALARDVVRSEARAAGSAAGSARGTGGAGASPGSGRVLFPLHDADARALAERLVALAASSGAAGAVPAFVREIGRGSHPPRAVGVEAAVLAVSVSERRAATAREAVGPADALVLSLSPARIADRRDAGFRGNLHGSLPLVETRPRLILRRGVSGVAVDGDGTPIVSGIRP